MFKNLLPLIALCLTACVVYVPGSSSHSGVGHSGSSSDGWYWSEVWIEDAYAQCEYDPYYGESYWYVEAIVGASYDYYPDEIEVNFFIDTWQHWSTEYAGLGMWTATFSSLGHPCYDSYILTFHVGDVYGNYDEIDLWW